MGNVPVLHIGARTRVARNASLVSATNYEPTATPPRPASLPLMSALVKIVKKKKTHCNAKNTRTREGESEWNVEGWGRQKTEGGTWQGHGGDCVFKL